MIKRWKDPLVVGAVLLSLLVGCANHGEKITVGDGDFYYKEGATKEDAQKVADTLTKDGFVDKSKTEVAKSIRVLKPGGKYVLEMVIKDEAMKDDNTPNILRAVVASDVAAEAFGGADTELHLCDNTFAVKKNLNVEYVKKTTFGKDCSVRASKDVSDEIHKSFTDFVSKALSADKSGVTFGLKKDGETYILAMRLEKDKMDAADVKETYTSLATELSKEVFKGAKVQVDLCDDSLTPKKSFNS